MKELLELLEHDARRPVSELASMLHRSEYEVEQDIKKLEKDKIILSYNTLINWEKFGTDTVTAIIEINLTPQREVGFDAIAERICPKGMGLIIRTVAAGQSEQSLAADVRYLVRLWESILARYKLKAKGSTLLYRDADLLIRLVRDRFTADIDELVIDNEEAYQRVRSLVEANSPELVDRIRFYEAKTPIFKAYHIEEEIEKPARARSSSSRAASSLSTRPRR